ncbi:hypothetical protein PG989_010620 [Apiospora arundinis]
MDPLSALAIAAAVVQFADIGGQLMVRTWRKYREKDKQNETSSEGQWIQETELEDALKELTLFTRTVRESTDRVVSPQAISKPAEAQLVKLCKECESIAEYFQDVLTAAKNRPDQKPNQRGSRDESDLLSGLWAPGMVGKMQGDLNALQQRVTSTVILCLWEDSKQTKKWEEDFGNKLNKVFWLLERIEQSTSGSTLPWVDTRNLDWLLNEQLDGQHIRSDSRPNLPEDPEHSLCGGRPTNDLVHMFSHFVASDKKKVSDGFKKTLTSETKATDQIYEELTSHLWQTDWQPTHSDSSVEARSPLKIPDLAMDIVELMTNGLRFNTFNTRQGAIPHTFQSTYRWIFDRQPKGSPEGLPLWHSFPDWLESTSGSVYWITGKPGSGKSTMMKHVTESAVTMSHLQKWSDSLPVIVISYYAWNAGQNLQKSWDGLRRTMLHQAISKEPGLVSSVCPRRCALAQALLYNRRFPSWESWEVEESFDLLLNNCGRTFKLAVFIDGLDEFDIDPKEVVGLIDELSSISTNFLKICVASRPWIQFDDAYSNVPMLRMHLLTKDDMIKFVACKLDANQGFQEILNVYPTQVQELKKEIVDRARGVFLWVSIVVQSLLISLSDGESLHDLQATLSMLPSDISSLYDVIWERTEERNRRDGSWMIQVLVAAQGPLECLTMWLADESRSTRADLEQLPYNFREHAAVLLKRKLASRTRGILEIADGPEKVVDFSHRTARDWVRQAGVWDRIRASYGEDFEPTLILFEAETLTMSILHGPQSSRWANVKKALWYASQSCEEEPTGERLVQLMDFFDESMQKYFEKGKWPSQDNIKTAKRNWAQNQNHSLSATGFLGLAAQFSILPYIRLKTGDRWNLPSRKPSPNYTSLLDCAVFGYEFFTGYDVTETLKLPPISVERRLETVKFLVDAGSAPGPRFGEYLAKEKERCGTGSHPVLLHYYDEVCAYIKTKTSVRQQAKGVIGWVSSVLRSPRSG